MNSCLKKAIAIALTATLLVSNGVPSFAAVKPGLSGVTVPNNAPSGMKSVYSLDFNEGTSPFAKDVNCIADMQVSDGLLNITRNFGTANSEGVYPSNNSKLSFAKYLPELQEGTVVSFYLYDDPSEHNQIVMLLKNSKASATDISEVYYGLKANYNTGSDSYVEGYWSRTKNSSSVAGEKIDEQYFMNNNERKAGWVKFTIDTTQKGEVSFMIDDDQSSKHTVDIGANNSFAFDSISLIDFWSDANYAPKLASEVYIDNLNISVADKSGVNPDVPTNPQNYDLLNKFGWTPVEGYEDYTNYEYSLNGGSSYVDCTSNPQTIPNEAYEAGMIKVRRKQTAMDQPFFEALSNKEAFTTNAGDFYVDFEGENDLDVLGVYEGSKGIENYIARSGNNSIQIIPKSEQCYNQYLKFDEDRYTEKVLSIWFYDSIDTDPTTKALFGPVDGGTGGRPWESNTNRWHFFINGGNKNYYETRINKEPNKATSVKRTAGWHEFTWDFTSGTDVVMSIDGAKVGTYASTGFEDFAFIDWWSGSSSPSGLILFDDLSITAKKENMAMPNAPTDVVFDDMNDTVSFDLVDGYDMVSMYEISYDGGQTWKTCNKNPQTVPNQDIGLGKVMIRVKAIDGNLAGATAKNDIEFTSGSGAELAKLDVKIDFANALFMSDYAKDDNYDVYVKALEKAHAMTADDEIEEIQKAASDLQEAISNLTLAIDDYNWYEFEKGEDALNPFIATVGNITKGEKGSGYGKEYVSHYTEKNGVALYGEEVDGLYAGEASYAFSQDLANKYVHLAWNVEAQLVGNQEILLQNSKGQYAGIRSKSGNQTNLVVFYNDGNGEVEVDTGIRRLGTTHNLEWDFVNKDGKLIFTMDEMPMLETNMTDFNQIIVKSYDATSEDAFVLFDRLQISEKNPVTSIKASAENATLGYFDTFDMAKVYLDLETEKDYPTTDKFTYSSTDEEVIYVTEDGSCEAAGFGKATATVTASSGVSTSVEIEVKDFKVEDLMITDSQSIDVNAIGANGQDVNNSKPVKKVSDIVLDVNESQVLNVVLTPDNATARLANWKSSDPSIVNVDNGMVTGVNYGTATITATSADGTGISDTVTVTIAPDKSEFDIEVFVSVDGDDFKGTGTIDSPFATIERARDEIRTINGVIPAKGAAVFFREGSYPISNTIDFNDQDSGLDGVPTTFMAYNGEKVEFVGGIAIDSTKMEVVDSDDVLYNRIDSSIRNKVYSIDLAQYNIPLRDLQVVGHSGGAIMGTFPDVFSDFNSKLPYFSLSLNGSPMTLARFPDEGYIKTTKVVDPGRNSRDWFADMILLGKGYEYEPGMEKETFSFTSNSISQEQLDSWKQSIYDDNRGAWMIGYWGAAFSDQSVPMGSIDGNVIKSGMISHYKPTNNANFYVYNLIEELDNEGEWYIDQSTDPSKPKLYFMPPTGTDLSDASNSIVIPTLDEVMFNFEETDNILINGIDVNGGNSGVVTIKGGSNNVIRKADVSNTIGKVASVSNTSDEIAKDNGFEMCTFTHIDGGIALNGGNDMNLERGYNYVENCVFTDISRVSTTYNPAVSLSGVGNRVTNSVFSDSPHNVIMFSGPESLIEFSEFYDCLKTAGDQGAIYTGRDTLNRGTVIRDCYFHDVFHSPSVENSGIYLDDAKAGVEILDCVFENTSQGITLGGGRDVDIIGCDFINLQVGIVTSPSGYIGFLHTLSHGLATICDPANYDNMTKTPWNDPNSAYGRFVHLAEVDDDNLKLGKYCKVMDNNFINMEKERPDANETVKDYNVWSKFWKVMPYQMQKDIIYDWIFTKNNDYSNNKGDDDLSYKATYEINLTAEGKGTVSGDRYDMAKNQNCKVVATAENGSKFVAWKNANGDVVSTNPVYFFNITQDTNLTAVFQ